MGAGISKVRSLKMDRKVWTETLIEVRGPPLGACVWGPAAVWPLSPVSQTLAPQN